MDRAQFLAGLRTGGPRSTSASYGQVPMTAGPATTTFSRFQMGADSPIVDDAADALAQMNLNNPLATATLDPRVQQVQAQQQALLLQNLGQSQQLLASGNISVEHAQAIQLQMRMDLLRLQAIQQQQNLQAQLMLQAQLQQQQQKPVIRRPSNHQLMMPASAAPFQTSFDTGAAPPTPAQTRFNAANTLLARALTREQAPATPNLSNSADESTLASPGSPMTPGGNGRFTNRTISGNVMASATPGTGSPLNPHAAAFVGRFNPELINTSVGSANEGANDSPARGTPQTPTAYGATTVISGGTLLGGAGGGNATPTQVNSPSSYNGLSGYNNSSSTGLSKSDSASSWRRGPATPGNGSPSPSPLASKAPTRPGSASPPKIGAVNLNTSIPSQPAGAVVSPNRSRPSPLTLRSDSQDSTSSIPSVAISSHSSDNGDGASNKSLSPTASSPPTSAGSTSSVTNAREEASKRLYEGLGIGRPAPSPVNANFPPAASNATSANVVTNLITQRSLSLNTNFPFQIPTVSTTAPTPIPPSAGALSAAGQTNRVVSQPHRQPRGPPAGVDELGPRNFASRIRKQAVGGLGVLMGARERRVSHGASTAEVVAF